jgi:Rrf2 family iron-sulfur cluster assembly transcriptional regulator
MSTKGRFAVNAMIDLALRERAGPVALASIAQRQRISVSYLEQLFARLRQRGLVESTRGPGGGYTLGRGAGAITVADIITAVDDGADRRDDDFAGATDSTTRALWADLEAVMLRHMATITLESLVKDQIDRGAAVPLAPARRAISAQPVLEPVRTSAPNSVFALAASFAT